MNTKPIFEDVDKLHVPLHDRLKTFTMSKINKEKIALQKKIAKLEKSIENHTNELEDKKKGLQTLKTDLDIINKIENFV